MVRLKLQRFPLHLSEQKRTFSQSRAHFLRQVKGKPQAAQVFVGKSDFLRILGMGYRSSFIWLASAPLRFQSAVRLRLPCFWTTALASARASGLRRRP
jgi:hypothetical protein